MNDKQAFIKKLETLTFGLGAKVPQVKKVKLQCGCGKTHDAIQVGPISVPFKELPQVIQDEIKQRYPMPKPNDETAFSA